MRQRRIEDLQSLATSFLRFRVRMLHIVLRHRRGGNFNVDGKSVLREFQDLLRVRLRRSARFSPFEFKVEVLLRGGLVSQSSSTLAKALNTLG
jgi:hypothetical protein